MLIKLIGIKCDLSKEVCHAGWVNPMESEGEMIFVPLSC
jgi:hypothetical protein